MALTETQKAYVRLWLGYPNQHRFRHTRLESVMTDLDAAAEAIIVKELDKLDELDAGPGGSMFSDGNLARVDDIWFHPATATQPGPVQNKLREVRVRVGRISITLGVPINADAWSAAGYPGDFFNDPLGQAGGASGRPMGRSTPFGLG